MKNTKDPVNNYLLNDEFNIGKEALGLMTSAVWRDDPKRLLFTLARYKFVSKMLEGMTRVVEVGCGDGFSSRVVAQTVGKLAITDYDPLFIERYQQSDKSKWEREAFCHDILEKPFLEKFDGLYCLDVLEHISPQDEDRFLDNCKQSLVDHGVAIFGMPSLESQVYASPPSKAGHVNCKTGKELKKTLEKHFRTIFSFSMNDEVVHTGFEKMAHYLIGLCVV